MFQCLDQLKNMTIKGFSVRDFKKVLTLLDALETEVSKAVTDEIISLIRAKEQQKEQRKLSKMTEEHSQNR